MQNVAFVKEFGRKRTKTNRVVSVGAMSILRELRVAGMGVDTCGGGSAARFIFTWLVKILTLEHRFLGTIFTNFRKICLNFETSIFQNHL